MPTDLNILKKAFANVAATYETAKPWEEPLTRRSSIETEQTLSAPTLPGEVGGWVASGGFPYATVANVAGDGDVVQTGVSAPSRRYFETNPGRAGYNDVDFVPYNWGTNRFGNKGGALVGHPISWEVVGPTSKSPFTHWQWLLDAAANKLTLEAGVMSASFSAGAVPTVQDGYGLDPAGLPAYNGGLYVLVTLASGLNDLLAGGRTASLPLPAHQNTYQYELFRVEGWAGQDLFLEAAKPLTDYFSDPVVGNSAIRAITIIRPKVTRLAALPLYNTVASQQRNQVYVVLPPERSAASEFMPPYVGAGLCPDWTVNGGFDVTGTIPTGVAADYGTKNALPVPLPVTTFKAFLTATVPSASEWEIQAPSPVTIPAVGQIVRVRVSKKSGILTTVEQARTLGYFEVSKVVGAAPCDITLKRVPEVTPATGEVFYGPGPTGGGNDELEVDLFDSLTSVFTDPVLNVRKVLASRLDHLIAPKNIEGSYQGLFSEESVRGASPSGPAIFDTTTDSNPGNLTGLGFRMVLFPAKDDGAGNIVPDFDNPIPTNARVVLDPSVTDAQYIEVDYDAGVVYLSRQPAPGAGCAVAPNGIIADPAGNPRNEVVLYAACVPYSREPSQRGPGVQVKTMRVGGELGASDSVDLYGQRLVCQPTPAMIGALTPTLVIEPPSEEPSFTGWFQLGELVGGVFTTMSAPMYYSLYDRAIFQFFGVAYSPYAITADTRVLILKGSPFAVKYDSDGVRGSSKRSAALNFRGTRTTVGADGTLTISPVATLDDAYRANDPSLPALGRAVTVDGKAIEARPDDTAGDDTLGASFRVDTRSATDASVLTGFDFVGKTSSALVDPYAGVIDRRVLSFTNTLSTFSVNPTCSLLGNVVTLPVGEFWWANVGGSKRSLLVLYFDLIEINDKTYVISGFGANPDEITVVELDLVTAPAFAASSTKVNVFRPKFLTGRGNTGNPLVNVNSWFMGQQIGANALLEPFGALNLYAGSSSSVGLGDGGGAVAALAFWSRVATAAGAGDEALLSTSYFDTMGRMVSTLNPDFMQGGSLPDYKYRGDFATRRVMGSYSAIGPFATPATRTQPTIGHIVEDYNYLLYRYDNLSMFPLLPDLLLPSGGLEYTGTTTASTVVDGEIATALIYSLLPYGSCIVEVTSVNGDATKYGLFRLYSTDDATHVYLRQLDGTVPTVATFPAPALPVNFRLYYLNNIGKVFADTYKDYGNTPTTQTPTQIVGVSLDNDAVGTVFSGPIRTFPVLAVSADRHAYRVTTYGTAGTGTKPSNRETAALDLDGYHKARDYLYNLPLPTITKAINPHTFNQFGLFNNPEWHWENATLPASFWWQANGNIHVIHIPLDLPRSSSRTDSAANLTHRTQLVSVTVNGQFHGGGANYATLQVYQVASSALSPATVITALLVNGGAFFNLPNAGADTSSTVTVGTNPGNNPVYIDDTENYTYYALVTSSPNNGNQDRLYSVQMTYTDPGPRNY